MSKTATKKKDAYAETLAKREAAMVEKVEKTREALVTEEQKIHDFTEAVQATEEALEEVEAKARAGDGDVTGLELLEARSSREVAEMGLHGATKRARQYGDWLTKAHTDKQVGEIVRDALVQRMLPGAHSYATFGGGFRRDPAVPDSLPALTVTQLDGGIGADGVGAGKLRITWFRSALHSPLDADRLRASLEGAGFRIDRSFGLNDGVTVMSREGADEAEIRIYNVADTTPVVTAPLKTLDDWDDALARDISLTHELIDAEGCGASILSSEVDGDIRTTVVRLNVAARTADRMRESHDINLTWIFKDKIADLVDTVRRGAGRCVEAKQVSASGGRGAAFLDNGKQVLSAELTYKGRVG